ncbi:MAG: ATP-binding cassette domain-containing protein [Acidobacteriales bacterium]|nr:ATP-binding cassette domain-containing protein [Terriglobales bacterium]
MHHTATQQTQQDIVSIRGLTKRYAGKVPVDAVRGIDLSVERGELFGLLGPNGAGKSTTIGVCTTRTLPTAGTVTIAGLDVVRTPAMARRRMGVVPQYNTLDRQCTVWENIYFHCRYFGYTSTTANRRAQELLEMFRLSERAKSPVRELSGGLAQRVQIARAIAHQPEILFLDEPSAGLDPQSRLALWDSIRQLIRQGITVVLTTHYMEEADALCNRVAIIDHGVILISGTPEELKRSVGAQKVIHLHLGSENNPQLQPRLTALAGIKAVEPGKDGVRIFVDSLDGLLPKIIEIAGPHLKDVSIAETTLETVFIKLTGRDLRE